MWLSDGSYYLLDPLFVKDSDFPTEGLWLLSLEYFSHPGNQGEDFCNWKLNRNTSGEREFPKLKRMPLPRQIRHWHRLAFPGVASALWNSSHQVTILFLGHLKPGATRVTWGFVRFCHSWEFVVSFWFLHTFQTYPENIWEGCLWMLLISRCHRRVYLCRASVVCYPKHFHTIYLSKP